jgi:hypothetical protein
MTAFDSAALVIAVGILLVLAACVCVAVLLHVVGRLIDLFAPGRGRREAFRRAALDDDLTALLDVTGCGWCDTGTGDCRCTSHCTFIASCRAEWTTTARAWAWTPGELAALRGDQELPR